jgi:hypothetical protein
MANQNYRQAKRQKEVARKARQLEKQQKRSVRPEDAPAEGTVVQPGVDATTPTP